MYLRSLIRRLVNRVDRSDLPVTHRQQLIAGFDQSRLSSAKGLLIGAGGIGSEIAEGLCRKGVGCLHLIDHDVVELTNLNRQHFFNRDIGRNKAQRLARNLGRHRVGATSLQGFPISLQDSLALGLDMSAAFVVCGVDNSETRILAARHFRRISVPVVFIAVDHLAECGHVFVQEARVTAPCFGCAFPNSLMPRKMPCFAASSKDILKTMAGYGLYAIDSLLMQRERNWNYRHTHLAGFAPDVLRVIKRDPGCPLCSSDKKEIQQGSPAVGAAPRRGSPGNDSPYPSL